ncbi:MAG: hypothetical protein ACOYNC_12575 [Bacteroidales bacterium]
MKNFLKIISSKKHLRATSLVQGMCLFLILVSVGCRKDFNFDKVKNLSWNPDLALPLVNDTITLKRVLTQGNAENHLYIDESGNISILYYYNNDAFRIRPNDLIKLSPLNVSFQHQVTQTEQNILAISDLTLPPVAFNLNINGNQPDMRVDKFMIKKMVVRVTSNHTFSNDGYLTVRIQNATRNGLPFSFTISPFTPGQVQTTDTIENVFVDLSSSPNTMTATVEGLLKKSGSPVAGDQILADFRLSIDTIGRFEGFLGHQTLTQLMDTVKVNVFNNAYTLGEVYFMDPQATISIVNSIGIPTDITIEKMIGINQVTGYTMDIADRLGAGANFSVPSPLINATQSVTKTMYYTNENTGNAMNDFFNIKPDHVAFQVKTVINPTGTPLNFFSDTSSFYGDLRIKLPLWGHFDHLTFVDTFDLVIDKPEELEHLEFRTNIANGLPLTALMQLYFTDEHYVIKDSLLGMNKLFIREAPVDPATYLPYPGVFGLRDTTFILDNKRMLNLKSVKKMLLKAVLHSADNGKTNVKLRADQALKLNFSARAKVRRIIETSK